MSKRKSGLHQVYYEEKTRMLFGMNVSHVYMRIVLPDETELCAICPLRSPIEGFSRYHKDRIPSTQKAGELIFEFNSWPLSAGEIEMAEMLSLQWLIAALRKAMVKKDAKVLK